MPTQRPSKERRIHAMVWAIDPKGALRAAGMNVDEMAKQAVESYESYDPAAIDQMPRLEEMASRIRWARERVYDLQNRATERMGTALWALFEMQADVDAIIKELEPQEVD